RESSPLLVDGRDVMPDVKAVLERMREFTQRVRKGDWTGFSGKPIRAVVNLGIGGSTLGPQMAHAALAPFQQRGPQVFFVANVDGDDLHECLTGLEPETTLFIVASKSFTTQETMANAQAARDWIRTAAGDDSAVAQHFVALSTNRGGVADFGIDPAHMFEFWDWVGGRFSLWSAIGLSVALAVGMAPFEKMLDGAHAMDRHFSTTPLPRNLPAVLAMLGIWNSNFLGASTHAVIPYAHRLRYLPAYLQQLEMESNGKSVTRDGQAVNHATAPVVWGEPGTNSQHSFFQLLHQGGRLVPVDFIGVVNSEHPSDRHRLLLANLVAQSAALMRGRSIAEAENACRANGCTDEQITLLAPHLMCAGNQPSSTLLLRRLTPYTLGQLLALYEHKTFVQGIIWGVNSFDQWGVELGKQLVEQLLQNDTTVDDSSTQGLLDQCRYWRISA
ncbi:MAG: glucose-6-phosphate isomerase, partial [Gammaproteobacteria bacterium]|nr:glucose-6-phosphate isomerase [Gammaproteobacteria bacterium]